MQDVKRYWDRRPCNIRHSQRSVGTRDDPAVGVVETVVVDAQVVGVGIINARPVAVVAGALRVGAEQRWFHLVGLGERLPDRVEQSRVRRRVAPPRTADRGLVDRHDSVQSGHRAVDQRALARAGHSGDDDEHAERDVDIDVLEIVGARAAHLDHA